MVDPNALTERILHVHPDKHLRPGFLVSESEEQDVGGQDADERVALRLVGLAEVATKQGAKHIDDVLAADEQVFAAFAQDQKGELDGLKKMVRVIRDETPKIYQCR